MEPGLRDRLRKMLRSPKVSGGASEERLQKLMADIGYRLPEDYLDFMRQWNGYNGDVGQKGSVDIWPAEEIQPSNEANRFREWVPGLVLFGSDGGGEFYAFDMRGKDPKVVMVTMIPLNLENAVEAGSSFLDFLERLAKTE